MVFVWSRLTNGDPLFTLSQVALNDTIMVVAFAPLVGLLLGISAITVPWGVKLCRPSEAVLDILPLPQSGPFAKEDGELVIDSQGQRVAPASWLIAKRGSLEEGWSAWLDVTSSRYGNAGDTSRA
jgi:ACR3 family arsenite transporter